MKQLKRLFLFLFVGLATVTVSCNDDDVTNPTTPPDIDQIFIIETSIIEQSTAGVTVQIYPSHDDRQYYCDLWAASEMGATDQATLEKILALANPTPENPETPGETPENPDEDPETPAPGDDSTAEGGENTPDEGEGESYDFAAHLHKGPQQLTFARTLEMDTDYYILCVGYDGEAFTSDLQRSTVIRLRTTHEDERFKFEYVSTTYDDIQVKCTPTDTELAYFVSVDPVSEFEESATDEEILAKIMETHFDVIGTEAYPLLKGEKVIANANFPTKLLPGTAYYISCFGVELHQNEITGELEKTATTALSKAPLTTDAPGDPSQVTFTTSYDKVLDTLVTMRVRPSDTSVRYAVTFFADSLLTKYVEEGGDANEFISEKNREWFLAHNEGSLTVTETYDKYGALGENTFTFEKLDPETKYRVLLSSACPGEEEGRVGIRTFQRTFTTSEKLIADATVSTEFEKYYDGDSLYLYAPDYSQDPERFAAYQGKAYVPVTYTHNAEAVTWYTALTSTDASLYTDEQLIRVLVSQGQLNAGNVIYAAEWGDHILISVAQDADGLFSRVNRKPISLVKENATSYEEFFTPDEGDGGEGGEDGGETGETTAVRPLRFAPTL